MRFPFAITPLLTRAAFFILLLLCVSARAAELSWPMVLARLDSSSPLLADSRVNLAAARAEFTSSRALPNPTFFAEGQKLKDGDQSEKEKTFGVRQPLGFLWSQSSRLSSKRLAYESEQAAFEEARREVSGKFLVEWLHWRTHARQCVLLDTVLTAVEQVQTSTNARLREGDISVYDAKRVEAERIQLFARRVILSNEIHRILSDLITESGLSRDELESLPPPQITAPDFADAEAAVQSAITNSLSLKQKSKRAESAKKAHAAAAWNQLPEFSLGLARKTADPSYSGFLWQAEVELPLWGQRRSEKNLARAQSEKAELQHRAERRKVEQECRAAMSQWQLLQAQTSNPAKYNADDAEQNLRRGLRLYISGDFSSLELVDALRTGLDALQSSDDLQTALLSANLELRRVTGRSLWEP